MRMSFGLATLIIGAAVLGAPTTSIAADACTLLSSEELAQITSQRVRKPRPDTAEKGTACRFGMLVDTVSISLWPTTAKDFEAFRKTLDENGANISNAPGIGDTAYFMDDDRIYVRVGNQGLTVSLGGGGTDPAPKRRETVVAIAKAGVAKLR